MDLALSRGSSSRFTFTIVSVGLNIRSKQFFCMEKETSLKFGFTKDNTKQSKPESLAIEIGKVQWIHKETLESL